MFFVCGVADKRTGLRSIFSGTTQKHGTVTQVENYTPRGATKDEYDWGEFATLEAATRTAEAVLLSVTNYATAARLAEEFAQEIVLRMESDRMWMLFSGEIELWLHRRVKVA